LFPPVSLGDFLRKKAFSRNPEITVNDDFNLKVVYSKEYVLIAAQPVNPSSSNENAESGTTAIPATIGADTKIGSSSAPVETLTLEI
jgi:hypothetical protein